MKTAVNDLKPYPLAPAPTVQPQVPPGVVSWFSPKIMVVDDHLPTLNLLGEALHRLNAEPRCFPSSQQAADAIKREKFDGVFLDWMMPELSGLELAERIRWSKTNSRSPIVMITGADESHAIRDCFRMGVDLFLHKPISHQQVRALFAAIHGRMLEERLRYQRVPVRVPVDCEWDLQGYPIKATGESVNLSTNGILVRLEAMPPAMGLVRLRFRLPEEDTLPLELIGQVVRCLGDEVGLRFVQVDRPLRFRLRKFTESELERTASTPASA